MYKKIMVPLDGSELAECVLPHVEAIVVGCSVKEVVFVRVVEPANMPSGPMTDISGVFDEGDANRIREQMDKYNQAAAEEYLDQVLQRVKLPGANLLSEVIAGKAAESLAEYATNHDVDIIAISTHGRSGISRWARGSVADRILHSACVPVLMARAPGCVPGI